MTEDDARNLDLGTRVIWRNDLNDVGYVRKTDMDGVFIEWDDGQSGWLSLKESEKIIAMEAMNGKVKG